MCEDAETGQLSGAQGLRREELAAPVQEDFPALQERF